MAGYIMTLDSEESLKDCIKSGIYSTRFGDVKNDQWNTPKEGTFADYLSMKEGDHIFFFIKRKIYGIGRLVNIQGDCRYLNYKNADLPHNYTTKEYGDLSPLIDGYDPNNRCICIFEPDPFFFKQSVDMDEALSSAPNRFRALRTMWKVSFIKMDDEESQALFDIILKRNESNLSTGENTYDFNSHVHEMIEDRVRDIHRMKAYRILSSASNGMTVRHEMALEAYLCSVLGTDNTTPFGKWDYVSHQVAASPFKPVDYMDKMDVFGYRYIDGYRTISKYLVVEIKKGIASNDAIEQIMKYVDWINQEYAHGDYSMIEAYVVASDFPDEVIQKRNEDCIRNYVKGYRPSQASKWDNVKLIRYVYYDDGIEFIEL